MATDQERTEDQEPTGEPERTGTIVRGADGSLYFIRSEVLEACKITEEDMAKFCTDLVEQNSGAKTLTLASGPVADSITITGGVDKSPGLTALHLRAYTSMCPGTMALRDPSIRIIRGNK